MREAAHSSQGAMGDINTMKKEVHRMTVRYNRLLKTQEKMIQEMEKSVARFVTGEVVLSFLTSAYGYSLTVGQ